MIPPLLNDFIGLQKDTALVSVLGIVEVLRQTQIDQSATFNGTYYLVAATLVAITIRSRASRTGSWRAIAGGSRPGGSHERRGAGTRAGGRPQVLRQAGGAARNRPRARGARGRLHDRRLAGKSTLLRCVNLLEPIDAGRILVDREEITARGVDVNRIRRGIGIVFQSFNLFPHMSVRENVTLAPRSAASRVAKPTPRRSGCSSASGSPTSATSTPTGSREASSSALRSSVRSRCSRGCCCSTRSPALSTPSSWPRCSTSSASSRREG